MNHAAAKCDNDAGSCDTRSCASTDAATTATAVLASAAVVLGVARSTSCYEVTGSAGDDASSSCSNSNICSSGCILLSSSNWSHQRSQWCYNSNSSTSRRTAVD
jgi:hypothetical protein